MVAEASVREGHPAQETEKRSGQSEATHDEQGAVPEVSSQSLKAASLILFHQGTWDGKIAWGTRQE